MRFPFLRRREADPDARRIALEATRPTPLSLQIPTPDARVPVDHAAPLLRPHTDVEFLREIVRGRVAQLAAAGALDEDNVGALHQEIDAWRRTWTQRMTQDSAHRRDTAALLVAQTVENYTSVSGALETTRTRLAHLEHVRETYLRGFGIDGPSATASDTLADLEQQLGAFGAGTAPATVTGRHLPSAQHTTTSTSGASGATAAAEGVLR